MVKYILKKIVYMIVTLWIILTATFFLMYTMPGDPTQASSKVLPEAVQENLKAKWGLDKPVTEQYVIYLKNLFQGNMGESYTTPGLTANTVIGERFPASLRLGIQAVVVGLVLGIILGVLAAFNRGKWIDFVTIFIAILESPFQASYLRRCCKSTWLEDIFRLSGGRLQEWELQVSSSIQRFLHYPRRSAVLRHILDI